MTVPSPSDALYTAIGERIRDARVRLGLTQEALGDLVGIGRTSITNIERGQQRLPVHLLISVAVALGQRPADLIPEAIPQAEPTLDSVPGLTDAERDWIRVVVSPPIAKEDSGASTA